ncbi:retroviral-like aspartic protease family protein [Sphingomonas sp. TDK1]|uniref:retroviral-like aspartic protease family protein n=1 Tax=Sphingomonas sp. TDK1 TaxID=453247 RepID=UPI0007D8CF17|nr:retroviral-like aspartic protease family protein [Sphingomonas sp. TDK1]OAN57314.1 hypothetical protein A7X12_08910 [Sphingomonas sp. TDK1]
MRTARRAVGIGFWLAVVVGAMPAQAACKVGRIAEIPITMRGMRAIVDTTVNGKPAPFILDSGAFFSIVPPAVAKALDLPETTAPPGFYIRGVGGSASAGVVRVAHFGLAGVDIPNVEFVRGGTDFGETGLLGQNILGLADVEYDLPGGAVRLFRPEGCGKLAMAYWAGGKPFFEIPIEPKETARYHTIGTVELDGAKLRAMFDTGASGTVVSLRAAARAGVKPGDPGVEAAGWSTGLGRRVKQGWIGSFKLLRVGNEELHNVRLRIADLGDSDTDMLLGADYLISHRLYVSNAQHRIYFTYTGGKLFEQSAQMAANSVIPVHAADAEGPLDAEGYARRGAMFQTQRDLPKAIEAFSQAISLAPRQAKFLRQRSMAYLAEGRPVLALDDLDAALALDPNDHDARLSRAALRLRAGNRTGAIGDLDQLGTQLPREDADRMRIAQLYSNADAYDAAIAQFDLWMAAHREDAGRARALNGRCWARALANTDLDKARSDCDAAVRAVPGNASYLDSRGLVALRQGRNEAAIADFNAALALEPKLAWSLYCRGIAEQRLGQKDAATQDFAAAVQIQPNVAERAKRIGLTTEAGHPH